MASSFAGRSGGAIIAAPARAALPGDRSDEQEHEEHHDEQVEEPDSSVPPVPAVAPARHRTEEQDDQDDQEDESHGVSVRGLLQPGAVERRLVIAEEHAAERDATTADGRLDG